MVLTVRFYTKKYDFFYKKHKTEVCPCFFDLNDNITAEQDGSFESNGEYHLRSVPILSRKTSKIHI